MKSAYLTPYLITIRSKQSPPNAVALLTMVMCIATCMITREGLSQQAEVSVSGEIAVTARPWGDSITLRWAPMNHEVWQQGINRGYSVSRYTIARAGLLLSEPEKTMIVEKLSLLPVDDWQPLITKDRYAAIAAQAIFGDRFEIDLQQSDVFTIVDKVRENDQRFAFALFASDMSPDVAAASALWFTDTTVRRNEKYLYRIHIAGTESLRGSIFLSPTDPYYLSRPEGVQVEFKEHLASLRWSDDPSNHYSAWRLERSEDGEKFFPLSETPMVTVAPAETTGTRYQYASDSVRDFSKRYYYRVIGITPFGESSPPSAVVSGQAQRAVQQPPYIRSAETRDNRTIHVEWEFPEEDNSAISGFSVERASSPRSSFKTLATDLSANARQYVDGSPTQSSYYRVLAHGRDGETYPSQLYLAQLVDSIPPSAPVSFTAEVSDEGIITLTWQNNAEPDIYGYRVYKGNLESEEFAQLTSYPVRENRFYDTVSLQTLNDYVFYRILAVDESQNQSPLSDLLRVELPDKVPPQPPVFLPPQASAQGVALQWVPSPSKDVRQYTVYRSIPDHRGWQAIATIDDSGDPTYHYIDEAIEADRIHRYTVLAVDDAGLESRPANAVSANKISRVLPPAVTWRKPILLREEHRLTLRWEYTQDGLELFRIYCHRGDGRPHLLKTLDGKWREFSTALTPGKQYRYMIAAVFRDGKVSQLSEPLDFRY